MINLCTVSDINFLIKGLTLYESIISHNKDCILHYLCIDDESYSKLLDLKIKNLKPYNVKDLLSKDNDLKSLKSWDYRYFCWSLASYFSNYLLTNNNFDVTYIDSDIFFHQDIRILLDEIGTNEIGIFRHRQFPLSNERPEGFYNVGVVHFKNKEYGRLILKWWSDAVLHMKYPNLATCGDQKYLDKFPLMCPKDCIFIDGDIGHGAPWQWQLYDFSNYEKNQTIIWEGQEQKLIFTQFSQFELLPNNYVPSKMHHIYTPLNYYNEIGGLKIIYDEYYNNLKLTKEKYNV
jgi:hypothetical protein